MRVQRAAARHRCARDRRAPGGHVGHGERASAVGAGRCDPRAEARAEAHVRRAGPGSAPDAQTSAAPAVDPRLVVSTVSPGAGAAAKAGDVLLVHYIGTLSDGTVFDTSRKPGRQPFRFTLGKGTVIKGWEQGLAGMRVGETRQLVIPPELAYGDRAQGPIPAGSTLFFRVEMLAINPP